MTPLLSTLLNIATIAFGLGTAGAVLVHDTSIDKAMVTAITVKSIDTGGSGTLSLGSNPHTHSERSSLFQAVRDLNASQPRTRPRGSDDRKYIQAKPSARGHHPFDNYTLPILS